MIPRVYDYYTSGTNPREDADTISAACLLGHNALQCGTSYLWISMPAIIADSKKVEQKARLFPLLAARVLKQDQQEYREAIEGYCRTMLSTDFSREAFLRRKRLEKPFLKFYDAICAAGLELERSYGYLQLWTLIEEGILEGSLSTFDKPEDPYGYNVRPNSEQLLCGFRPEERAEPHLFMLQPWLESALGDSGPGGQRALLRLPALHVLSASEQMHLREELEPQLAPFREAMDRWIGGEEHAYEAVLAASGLLQEKLDTHPFSESYPMHWARFEVRAGLMRIGAVWQAYRDKNAMPDETWAVLERNTETGNLLRPVLLTRYQGFEHGNDRTQRNEHSGISKKSLAID